MQVGQCRSVHSSTTMGLKSRKLASFDVAATHWFVRHAADEDGLGVERPEDGLERVEERGQPALLDEPVLLADVELTVELEAPRSDASRRP